MNGRVPNATLLFEILKDDVVPDVVADLGLEDKILRYL